MKIFVAMSCIRLRQWYFKNSFVSVSIELELVILENVMKFVTDVMEYSSSFGRGKHCTYTKIEWVYERLFLVIYYLSVKLSFCLWANSFLQDLKRSKLQFSRKLSKYL